MPDSLYNLETPLITFDQNQWFARNAVEGVQIFGGIGSGKTSGSGRTLAHKYLNAGYGGLVLTVKRDECELWLSYAKECGREQDVKVIHPEGLNRFNFLDYEANRSGSGAGLVENIVMVLKTVIRAKDQKQSSSDPFWDDALDMLLFNVIDLCLLSEKKLSIDTIYKIAQSLPKKKEQFKDEDYRTNSAFGKAFFPLFESMKNEDSTRSYEDQMIFNQVFSYFWETLINLNERTRSIIEHSFWGLLFRLSRDPIYSLFCSPSYDLKPEDCIEKGTIIIIDLPVKLFDKVGSDAQILFKYIWQRAMERRDINQDGGRPVFLWADEAQNFIHEHDIDYQATARSARVCTVYLTQNLPNYLSHLGGKEGEYRVKSFLGTLSTKIFHANADFDTNEYAAKLFGQVYSPLSTRGRTIGKDFTESESYSWYKDYDVAPEKLTMMKTGGPGNQFAVDAFIHCQGMSWTVKNEIQNYSKIRFNQKPQT